MKKLNIISLSLASVAMMGVLTACETTFYDEEQYRKEIYIVSDDNNMFGQEYTFGDEAVGNLSIYAAGTTPIEHDVTAELEVYPDYLRSYNQRIYGSNYANYAKAVATSDYTIESMSATIKADSGTPYVQLPIKVKVENLTVDDAYYIPLRIKSVSDYMISAKKRDVLFRVYLKNDYATTKSTTYYTMTGTEQNFTINNKGEFETDRVPSPVNSTKVFTPVGKYSIRMLPGSVFSTSYNTLRNQGIKVTVHPDELVDVPVLEEGVETGEVLQRQKVTLETWQVSSTSLEVADVEGKQSYYDPETQTFTLNYRYKLPSENTWHFMYEISTPLSVTNK